MSIVKYHVVPEIGACRPKVEEHDLGRDIPWFRFKWRWSCSCGARGRWQYQSPDVSMFAWFTHAGRKRGAHDRRSTEVATIWHTAEREAARVASLKWFICDSYGVPYTKKHRSWKVALKNLDAEDLHKDEPSTYSFIETAYMCCWAWSVENKVIRYRDNQGWGWIKREDML